MKKSKPRNAQAVLISDVHYSVPTLDLADAALNRALRKAESLGVPLIIAGDLHDTKGSLRAECVNKLLGTMKRAEVPVLVLVGNHDLINEKGTEHALQFLDHLVTIVAQPTKHGELYLIPYQSDSKSTLQILRTIEKGSTLIMHTGVLGAAMGHYVKDKSSLPPEAFKDFRVISGHYHKHQVIKCGGNLFTYIGNPYTLNYGEAFDGPKGFQILYSDGTTSLIPTNLRKHMVVERICEDLYEPIPLYNLGDLLKIKVKGPKSELEKIDRHELGLALLGHSDYKLDLVPDSEVATPEAAASSSLPETFDALIEATSETPERKQALKDLWRALV